VIGSAGGRPHSLVDEAPADDNALVESGKRPDVDDPGGSIERVHDDRDRVDEVTSGELDAPPLDRRRQPSGEQVVVADLIDRAELAVMIRGMNGNGA
jgi:hypothetical protein